GEPDVEALKALYSQLEIRALLRLAGDEAAATAAPATGAAKSGEAAGSTTPADAPPAGDRGPRNYETVTTKARLKHWLKKLEKAELTAFDTETTSLNYMEARIVGLSFAVEPGEAAYVPLGH